MTTPLLSFLSPRAPTHSQVLPPATPTLRRRKLLGTEFRNPPEPPIPPDPPPNYHMKAQATDSSTLHPRATPAEVSTTVPLCSSLPANSNSESPVRMSSNPYSTLPLPSAPRTPLEEAVYEIHQCPHPICTFFTETILAPLQLTSSLPESITTTTVAQSRTKTIASFLGDQIPRPPANLARYGNSGSLVLVSSRLCVSVHLKPPQLDAGGDAAAPTISCKIPKMGTLINFRALSNMDLNSQTDLQHTHTLQPLKPKTHSKASKPNFNQSDSSYLLGLFFVKLDPRNSNIAQNPVTLPFTSSVLMARTIALQTAIIAAPFEIDHLSVSSHSQSLVSLVITAGDVNELRSILVDIRCLLEPFSSISLFYVSRLVLDSTLSTFPCI